MGNASWPWRVPYETYTNTMESTAHQHPNIEDIVDGVCDDLVYGPINDLVLHLGEVNLGWGVMGKGEEARR